MQRSLVLSLVLAFLALPSVVRAEVTAEETEAGVVVQVDGQPFAEYLKKSGNKPVVWPVIGPTGKHMTRYYPQQDVEGETKDHIHHRSLWFTHGNIGGVSFWDELEHSGTIKHREFTQVEGGEHATIKTVNDYLAKDGRKVCEDERTLVFGADDNERWIDFTVTLKASEGDLEIGDTKEGSFGVRVRETMKVDANQGGTILNSEGQTNLDAWGKPASWVDYTGPVDGETLGIAILNHPSSFRYPTRWHVRTYGLFAANPFGAGSFGASESGAHQLAAGDTLTLRYRVLLHKGNETKDSLAKVFEAYSEE